MKEKAYAQLYSIVRQEREGHLEAFRRFAEIGYDGVELLGNNTNGLSFEGYKKYLKDGYTTVLIISDGYHCSMVAYRGKMTLSEIESRFPDTVKKMREGMYKNVKPKERLYTSLDDFSVVVDKNHLVPAYVNID